MSDKGSRDEFETTHVMADGTGLTACCGRTPFELPRTDRLAQLNVGQVNCVGDPS